MLYNHFVRVDMSDIESVHGFVAYRKSLILY